MDFLVKSEGAEDGERRIAGFASAGVRDLQNETVIQKGLDCESALKSGYVNWDHHPGPDYLIGWPTKLELLQADDHPDMRKRGVSGLALWAEGTLWRSGRSKCADAVWDLIHAIADSPQSGRRLAWSIQGRVLERDGPRITKSQIQHLALTHQPILQVSFADVVKSLNGLPSMVMNTGSAHPLMLENLDGVLTSTLWGDCVRNHYDNKGRFWKGTAGALEHLKLCKGLPLEEGRKFLYALKTSGLGA
jgi:hypothetical protein